MSKVLHLEYIIYNLFSSCGANTSLMPFCLLVVLPYRWSLVELVEISYIQKAFLRLMPSSVIEFSAFSKDVSVQLPVFLLCVSLSVVALPLHACSGCPLVPLPNPIAADAGIAVGASRAYG